MADKFSDGTALGDGLPVLKRPPRSQARLGLVGVRNRPQDCSWWRLLSLVAQGRPQSGSWGSKRRTESVGGRCPTEPEHAGTLARLSGQLKSLTPKLVDDVDILNGPVRPRLRRLLRIGSGPYPAQREADRPLHGSLSRRIIRRVPHFACTWIAHHIRSPIPV